MEFITGITLLNTYTQWNIPLIIMAIFIFVIMIIVIIRTKSGEAASLIIVVAISLLGSFCCRTTRYQVIVDDSVSFNEIMEEYNIIEQDGDIWTIEVKGK